MWTTDRLLLSLVYIVCSASQVFGQNTDILVLFIVPSCIESTITTFVLITMIDRPNNFILSLG